MGISTTYVKKLIIAATIATVAAHELGSLLSWYQNFTWYDTFVHTIGGFWVAVTVFGLLPRYVSNAKLHSALKEHTVRTLLYAVLVVALLWELFEFMVGQYITYTYNVSVLLQPGLGDTVLDIVAGLAGAAIAAIAIRRIK
ncbi:MAG TPA: hypothetical protein ENH86_01755 [Candidatus Jorgensenbacteria bacterium]|uniref:VanZ-like domain-containing protein n=1 Tax=marine sediment metagenome TaxID=412755 RepID=A0A0F9AXI8_9ZZZZ|nr:hypothetical protein [Candidatus Jorgensenbacteria bacterium]